MDNMDIEDPKNDMEPYKTFLSDINITSNYVYNELPIMENYVKNHQGSKVFKSVCYEHINKNYLQVLVKLLQYTTIYNEYIINFLERNPTNIVTFQELFFSDILHSLNFIEIKSYDTVNVYTFTKIFNSKFIHCYANRYSQYMVSSMNSKGENLLMIFCSNIFSKYTNNFKFEYYYYVISLLISQNIDTLHLDKNKNSILHVICRHIMCDHLLLVEKLVYHVISLMQKKVYSIINVTNDSGYTCLDYAILSNNVNLILLLLRCNAEVTKYGEMVLKRNHNLGVIVDKVLTDNLIKSMESCKI